MAVASCEEPGSAFRTLSGRSDLRFFNRYHPDHLLDLLREVLPKDEFSKLIGHLRALIGDKWRSPLSLVMHAGAIGTVNTMKIAGRTLEVLVYGGATGIIITVQVAGRTLKYSAMAFSMPLMLLAGSIGYLLSSCEATRELGPKPISSVGSRISYDPYVVPLYESSGLSYRQSPYLMRNSGASWSQETLVDHSRGNWKLFEDNEKSLCHWYSSW